MRSVRGSLTATLHSWRQRHQRRSALRRRLHEINLPLVEKDIGVSRGALTREARKHFWQD